MFKLMKRSARRIVHLFFEFSIILKGIFGVLQILAGACLIFIKLNTINAFIGFITHRELLEDPTDKLGILINGIASNLSLSTKLFIGAYLLIDGSLKLFLVICLLKNKMWAYPLSISVLCILGIVQIIRLMFHYSVWIVALVMMDIFVIFFISLEYRNVRRRIRKYESS